MTALIHSLGLLAAVHALLTCRTPEGSIAWAVSLLGFPYLTLPFYLVFGHDKFHGYVRALRSGTLRNQTAHHEPVLERLNAQRYANPELCVLEKLARIPFAGGCSVKLLIDGAMTYEHIYALIEGARDYVLVLFFIINNDNAGRNFRDHLCRKAREGVRVYLVYDEMGSHWLDSKFLQPLQEAGVTVTPFRSTRGWRHKFQLNFRNHRKIVIADGERGITGGINVGDDCLGYSRHYREWRDTCVELRGPAVLGMQLIFLEDYYWATGGEVLELDWDSARPAGNQAACYLASGPADSQDVGVLFFMECIARAKKKLWLATPYFVPDPAVMQALKLADLRGVDVRILIPPSKYERQMRWAAMAFLPELMETGIKLYQYRGYNHSKVMLVDEELAWVGSSNLDNRSLRLNFEGNLVVTGGEFIAQVEEMFERDFGCSQLLTWIQLRTNLLLTRLARLFVHIA